MKSMSCAMTQTEGTAMTDVFNNAQVKTQKGP